MDGEIIIAHRQWNEGSNLFSFSLTFGNPIRTIRGKTWGILGNSWRCHYCCHNTHVSLLRGKGWVIHNWGMVRTCVGILRVSIAMGFWGVSANFDSIFTIIIVNYICLTNQLMFWWGITVKLMCFCVECESLKNWVLFINVNYTLNNIL